MRQPLVWGLVLVSFGACGSERPAVQTVRFGGPRPLPDVTDLHDSSLAECARCHTTIAAEWAASLHRHAFDNPVFDAAYESEPRASCRNCHAPTRNPEAGIDCRTCHVRDGFVIGADREPGSPHRGPLDPSMARAEACADCHQFDFPDDVDYGLEPSGAPMQDTLAEWLESPASHEGRECQTCHMPARGADGHLDHRFEVRTDPAMLRSALELEVEPVEGADETRVTLRPSPQLGHAMPTGDLFRQLALIVRAADGTVVWERTFAREFRADFSSGVVLRRDAEDNRVHPRRGPIVSLIPSPLGARVQLDYLLMPPRLAARSGIPDSLNRTHLFDLALPAPRLLESTE